MRCNPRAPLALALLWPALSLAQLPPSPTEIKRREAEQRAQQAEKRAAEAEAKLKALQQQQQAQTPTKRTHGAEVPANALPLDPLLHGRYQVLGDGSEVKDVKTGLVWARCSVGQRWGGKACAGEAKEVGFSEAQKLAGAGWRLPTVRELASLVYCRSGEYQYQDDVKDGGKPIGSNCQGRSTTNDGLYIRSDLFPNTSVSPYLTSSQYQGGRSDVWVVTFYYGLLSYSDTTEGSSERSVVRLVRASK